MGADPRRFAPAARRRRFRSRFAAGSWSARGPVSDDLIRRFILSAAESGIDIFRLHDPMNDVENLAPAAAAVREAGGRLYAGLAFSGKMSNLERVVEKARRLAEIGADHVLLHDPAGALDPGTCGQVVARLCRGVRRAGRALLPGHGRERARDGGRGPARGAEPIATAAYPVAASLNRVAAEFLCDALTGLGIEHGVDTARSGQRRGSSTTTSPRRCRRFRSRRGSPCGRRSTGSRSGSWPRSTPAFAPPMRPTAWTRCSTSWRGVREDCGMPPLAQPIGGILAVQAVRHVLSARRWADASTEMRRLLGGGYGSPPMEISDIAAAFADYDGPAEEPPDMDDLKARAGGAPSEEDLLLLALFGDDATRLIETLRGRGAVSDRDSDSLEPSQSERIRELIRMVEDSDVGELTLQDGPVRITVRRHDDRPPAPAGAAAAAPLAPADEPDVSAAIRLESPMVGTFYRSPSPSQPAFVDEGDRVEIGQTLCILEAMKLFNEFKAEHAGVIRRILVANAEPVEYGQPLFELEPA